MKRVLLAALAWLMLAAPVAAQWQVPNYAVPIGRGSGTGFKSAAPGTAGRVLTSNGVAADPSFIALNPSTVVYVCAAGVVSSVCNFTGDGTNDQVAVNAAVAAARAVSSYSKVVMLPGAYTFSAAANLGGAPGENGFVFEARGTFVNGPGVGGAATALDTFVIQNSNHSEFNFGSIKTNNTGTAAAIHSTGNYSETKITWQALDGTARGGYGYFADTTSAATSQSVNWIDATHVQNFNRGIVLIATGASANIDTYRSTIDYIYNNNIGVYVEGNLAGSNQVNGNIWNVNIDASHTAGDVAFKTNAWYDLINATLGPVSGTQRNIVLDPGATSIILNLKPYNLAVTSGSIEDNSGNTTNSVNVGMPTAFLAATDARNSIAKWDGITRTQLSYTGISFGSPIGTSQKQLYFSSAGVISDSKVDVTQPATGSTLTIDDGKTLRAANSLIFAGTDGTTLTGPTTDATLARTDAAQTFTGTQTFSSTISGSISGNAATVTTNANLTGDVTSVGNTTMLATVNSNVGSFGSSTSIPTLTVNGKGLVTAASGNAVVAPAGTLTGTTLASGVTASSLTSAAGGSFAAGAYNTTGPNSVALTSGSGVYTVSANVKYIKIRLVGPGGGGSGSGTGAGAGGNGSAATTLSVLSGAVIISGGAGVGGGTGSNGGAGGASSGGNVFSMTGGNGGSGPNGITTNFPGADGAGTQLAAGGAGGNTGGVGFAGSGYGAGGGGGGEITTPNVGSGGGAGGYVEHIINNPAASYDYVIGAGGAAGTAGTGGAAGGAGFAGVILIEEHFNY